MGQIYLVRHGQASFGATDYDRLSELGVEQGRMLGHWFADCGLRFTAAMSGGLLRHRQTAEACLAAMPETLKPLSPVLVDRGFDEYDHREVLLKHRPEFATEQGSLKVVQESARPGDTPRRAFQRVFMEAMGRWVSGRYDHEYSETWGTFRQRCNEALTARIEKAGSSQSIVIFTSGGTISVICQSLMGISDRETALLNSAMVNSAVTKLLYQPGRISINYLNAHPHLERSGSADNITYR